MSAILIVWSLVFFTQRDACIIMNYIAKQKTKALMIGYTSAGFTCLVGSVMLDDHD